MRACISFFLCNLKGNKSKENVKCKLYSWAVFIFSLRFYLLKENIIQTHDVIQYAFKNFNTVYFKITKLNIFTVNKYYASPIIFCSLCGFNASIFQLIKAKITS